MIYIDVKAAGSIEKALRIYKTKSRNIGDVNELRDRKEFVKPSVVRRKELLKAKYMQKKRSS